MKHFKQLNSTHARKILWGWVLIIVLLGHTADLAGQKRYGRGVGGTSKKSGIEDRQVQLCRYFEEQYNRVMEDGGGLSEEIMEKLDEAFLSLLSGTTRKR